MANDFADIAKEKVAWHTRYTKRILDAKAALWNKVNTAFKKNDKVYGNFLFKHMWDTFTVFKIGGAHCYVKAREYGTNEENEQGDMVRYSVEIAFDNLDAEGVVQVLKSGLRIRRPKGS